MKKYLIIIRGLPGSGKSTLAKVLAGNEDSICTADDFLMEDGEYKWNKDKLGLAHSKCMGKCRDLMKSQTPKIIIANTTTTKRELKPYYDLAREFGYTVFSVIVENRHEGKNEHSVPEEAIQRMKDRFDIEL